MIFLQCITIFLIKKRGGGAGLIEPDGRREGMLYFLSGMRRTSVRLMRAVAESIAVGALR